MFQEKIGILGGGQLGAMLMRSAIDFGVQVYIMEVQANAPAARYTEHFTVGDCLNYYDVLAFGEKVDIITIEKEAVNTAALKELQKRGKKVYPDPQLIETIQDKWLQKQALIAAGLPVAEGIAIDDVDQLKNLSGQLPFVLKTRRNGYDGYGVQVMRTENDFEKAFNEPSLTETLVAIEHEIAVMAARNSKGELAIFEPVLMSFDPERNILSDQECPAPIAYNLLLEAKALTKKIAEELALTGLLAVEFFITKDQKVIVNEMAPRPHNSGHHTIETCVTSQYEQLIRALLNLPLGDTTIIQPSVMVNVLEPEYERNEAYKKAIDQTLATPNAHWHWYGKSRTKVGRKIGHITIAADTLLQAKEKAQNIKQYFKQAYEQ